MILKPKSGAALGGPDCVMGDRGRQEQKIQMARVSPSCPFSVSLFLSLYQ